MLVGGKRLQAAHEVGLEGRRHGRQAGGDVHHGLAEAAGGLTQRGTQRGLRVSRRAASGQVQSLELSLEDALQAGDVVFVKESLF